MMRKIVSGAHYIVSLVTLAAIVAEFFLAGLGVFHAATFSAHQAVGMGVTCAALLLLLLSLAGWIGPTRIWLSALLTALMIVQNLLVHLPSPYVEALHPVNGLAVMGVAATLVRTGRVKREAARGEVR